MEKALVHSSPSSTSILLPVASASTNAAKPRKPWQGVISQGLPVADRLFADDLYVNWGFCNPHIQPVNLVAK
jgi:hypothetical protein